MQQAEDISVHSVVVAHQIQTLLIRLGVALVNDEEGKDKETCGLSELSSVTKEMELVEVHWSLRGSTSWDEVQPPNKLTLSLRRASSAVRSPWKYIAEAAGLGG